MSTVFSNSKRLRRVGFTLFIISFLTPNWNFEGMGIGAFIVVPELVWAKFSEGEVFSDIRSFILISSLSLGWLSNFTVFFRLPRHLALTAISAPWILYLAMILFFNTSRLDFGVVSCICFYPWAFGIGIIHSSRLIEQCSIAAASSLSSQK